MSGYGYFMVLLSFLIIFLLVQVGIRIERKWMLSRYYISPPLLAGSLGSIVLILAMWVTGVRWTPESIVGPSCDRFLILCRM
jgi:hypothetical protein